MNTKQKEEIINEWYKAYSSSLFQFVLLYIQDRYQAEDITQEAFLKAYKKLHTFDYHSQAKTWLFRIAHNLSVDYYRKRKPIQKFKELIHLQKAREESPEEIYILEERSQEIFNALQQLKLSYRKVILLRKVKEFSTKETAHILGWSESKVKSTLSRALQALEKVMGKEVHDEKRNKA